MWLEVTRELRASKVDYTRLASIPTRRLKVTLEVTKVSKHHLSSPLVTQALRTNILRYLRLRFVDDPGKSLKSDGKGGKNVVGMEHDSIVY